MIELGLAWMDAACRKSWENEQPRKRIAELEAAVRAFIDAQTISQPRMDGIRRYNGMVHNRTIEALDRAHHDSRKADCVDTSGKAPSDAYLPELLMPCRRRMKKAKIKAETRGRPKESASRPWK